MWEMDTYDEWATREGLEAYLDWGRGGGRGGGHFMSGGDHGH
ncbi:hypothetical protein HDG38_003706 [Paraburkholderia sp. WSM4177]|nr:hypothetical protein [Paraburkholderia sp. WSM4177]MBB5484008.1 hypothetical protein [Paraburkholderia sp. WSM4180]